MGICDKCKEENRLYFVKNYYTTEGVPRDTEMAVCKKCLEKFNKYMTKKYNDFFFKEGYVRFKPCICGSNRRAEWSCLDTNTGEYYKKLVCMKCKLEITGSSREDAKRNWNKYIEEHTEKGEE